MEKQDFILKIASKTGRDISKTSKYPDEEEVLFERNKLFKIKKVLEGAGINKSTIILTSIYYKSYSMNRLESIIR